MFQSVIFQGTTKLLLDTSQYQSEVWASADVHIFDCTCSICEKKQNRHFIVLASRFKLLKGTKPHTHSTGTKHNTPVRDGMFRAFTLSAQTLEVPDLQPPPPPRTDCLDEGAARNVVSEEFNGICWEKAMKEHKTIQNLSKE